MLLDSFDEAFDPICGHSVSIFIRVLNGASPGREFLLEEPEVVCGRGGQSDFLIDDSKVSRRHCRFVPDIEGSQCRLEDLGSSNGTFVNDSSIQSKVLASGDRIRIGNTLLEFVIKVGLSDSPLDEDSDKANLGEAKPVQDLLVESYQVVDEEQRFVQEDSDLDLVYRMSLIASGSLTVETLCCNVSQLVRDWGGAEQALLVLLASNERDFADTYPSFVPRQESSSDDTAKPKKVNYSLQLVEQVINDRLPSLSSFQVAPETLVPAEKQSATDFKAMCVPVDNGEKLLGLIYIDKLSNVGDESETVFASAGLRTLAAVGKQTAAAIENIQTKPAGNTAKQLVSAVSHRINNLVQLSTGGEFLVDTGLDSNDLEQVVQGWKTVRQSQNRITQISVNLSTYCHDFEPMLRELNLHNLIELAASEIGNSYDRTRLKIVHQTAPDLTLKLDSHFCCRGIENLLCVALMASDSGDGAQNEVLLETSLSDESVLIRVDFHHFDDRFDLAQLINAKGEITKIKGDLGMLELFVSRKIVEGQGGSIKGGCEAGNANWIEVRFPMG